MLYAAFACDPSMYINIRSPIPQHVRMTARVLLLALHCLVFSVFIFAARGDKFCAQRQVSNTSVRLETAQWNPVHDQLFASLTPASECQDMDCGQNKRPLFKNVQGEREEYTCVCVPGLYMKPGTTSCVPCGSGRICIGTDDGRFRCPEHSSLKLKSMPKMREFKTGEMYCLPDPGYRLQSNTFSDYRYRIFTKDGSNDLYVAVGSDRNCLDFEVLNDRNECMCAAGFYRDRQTGLCLQCAAGFFCSGSESVKCTESRTSLPQSSLTEHCNITRCQDGKFWDATSATCLFCPVGSFCRSNSMIPCPAHATTMHIGSDSPELCRCVPGYSWQKADGVPANFVCVWQQNTYLEEYDLQAILPTALDYHDAVSWTFTNPIPPFIGAVVRLDNRKSMLQITAVMQGITHHSHLCDLEEYNGPFSMYNCSLGDVHGTIGNGDASFTLQIFILCYDVLAPHSLSKFVPITATSSATSTQCQSGAVSETNTADLGIPYLFQHHASSTLVRVHVEATEFFELQSFSVDFINDEIQQKIYADISGVVYEYTQGTMTNYHTRDKRSVGFSATCYGAQGAQASETLQAEASFTPAIEFDTSGFEFCIETPSAPDVDIVFVSAHQKTITVKRHTKTVLKWANFSDLELLSDDVTEQQVYSLRPAFESCYDATVKRLTSTVREEIANISRLSRLQLVRQFYPLIDLLQRYDEPENETTLSQNLFDLAEEDLKSGTQSFVDMSIFLETLDDIRIDTPLNLILNTSDEIKNALEKSMLQRLTQGLFSCISIRNETQRFGETIVNVSGRVKNITTNIAGVFVEVVDQPKRKPQRQCFNALTCATAAATPEKTTPRNFKFDHVRQWYLGIGQSRFIAERMIGANKYWAVVNFDRQECPKNAIPQKSGRGCQCKPGFKRANNLKDFSCAPCLKRESCESDHLPVICDVGNSNAVAARCACADGYRFNESSASCVECDEFSLCTRGLASFCGDKMKLSSERDNTCNCLRGYAWNAQTRSCSPCPKGFWCSEGRATPCSTPGMTTKYTHSTHVEDCVCDKGHSRLNASAPCLPCSLGFFKATVGFDECKRCEGSKTTLYVGQTSPDMCVCAHGYLKHSGGDQGAGMQCQLCTERWSVCRHGEQQQCPDDEVPNEGLTRCICALGFFRGHTGKCLPCPRGSFCANEAITPCQQYMTSRPGAYQESDCYCEMRDHVKYKHGNKISCSCRPAFYESVGGCLPCPKNSARLLISGVQTDGDNGCRCLPGFYKSDRDCATCPKGFYCPSTAASQQPVPCPPNSFSIFSQSHTVDGCVPCNNSVTHANGNLAPFAWSPIFCHRSYLPFDLQYTAVENSQKFPLSVFYRESQRARYDVSGSNCLNIDEELTILLKLKVGLKTLNIGDYCSWTYEEEFTQFVTAELLRPENRDIFDRLVAFMTESNFASDLVFDVVFCSFIARLTSSGECSVFRKTTSAHRTIQEVSEMISERLVPETSRGGSVQYSISSESSPAKGLYDMIYRFFVIHDVKSVFDVTKEEIEEHIAPVQIEYGQANVVGLFAVSARGAYLLSMIDDISQHNDVEFEVNVFLQAKTERETNNLCSRPVHFSSAMAAQQQGALDCAASQSLVNSENKASIFCYFCAPGAEFRNADNLLCETCKTCQSGTEAPCCGKNNTACAFTSQVAPQSALALERDQACGNGVVDIQFGEECDFNSNQTNCCGVDCRFLPGFYSLSCSTFCGDNIAAGEEVCDNDLDPLCNPSTCRCYSYRGVRFDDKTRRCVYL